MVSFPDCCLKPLSTGVADGNVWEEVIPVVRYERICEERPERMMRARPQDIVAKGPMATISSQGWVV